MKAILAALLTLPLIACTTPPAADYQYQLDTAAYARANDWQDVTVNGPGVRYDANGQAIAIQ